MENWIGAGPAACGTIINDKTGIGKRFSYPAEIKTYLLLPDPCINYALTEELDRADLIKETLLMGFRCVKGPDTECFKSRFNCGIEDCIPKTINRWYKRGFFEPLHNNKLAPSKNGLIFLNGFLRDAFEELEYIDIH
jgi:coproporphyrinogen III oxidase-like Fe-S oxidoreductase